MKKNYFFNLLLTFFLALASFGQGAEPFTNVAATNSYADGSFVGENSITWSYVASRQASGNFSSSITTLNLPALMLRRSSDDSKITSSTISGGIGDFSVKLYKGFTGGGNRQVELFINGVSKGTSDTFDDYDEHIFTVTGLNITGDIIIEIKNTTSKQVIIDDITWTAPSSDPSLSISSPTESTVYTSTTVQPAISISNFTVSGDNGSGMSDNSGDGYIKASLETIGGSTEVSNFFSTTLPVIELVPGASYTLTIELVDNTGASLTSPVSESVSFSADYDCDLTLGTITTTCDDLTTGSDTYSGSIAFTGGNTGAMYTITAPAGVTVAGDNPDTIAEGTITFSGMAEGEDAEITIVGSSQSTCSFTRTLESPTCVPAPTCPAVGSLIVTEIMQNPNAVSDSAGEYFEVYNTTSSAIEMQGWTIKSLTTDSKDHVIASSLLVPANGYVVLGINSEITANGGVTVDYQYGSNFYLGNSSDSIALDCGGSIIDSVSWDNGATFPDPTGISMELATDQYSETDNDTGSNWAEATAEIVADGDLGTPGAVNSFVLSVGKESILGFATYPNPITNKRFTVSSSSSEVKQLTIFNVLGKQVFTTSFSGLNKNVDVSTITSGVYILKITEEGKTATKKLVIR
jgi:hypothetical protein